MKLNKFVSLLVIGLVMCVAASGCKKKPVKVTEIPGQRAGAPPGMPEGDKVPSGETAKADTGPKSDTGTGTEGHVANSADLHRGWLEDAQTLKTDTVYFDFDSSVIKASEKPKVAAVAEYLKANVGKAVRVEGNCDERGTEEYNRSLGERRATAVREELIRLGIGLTEVDTISYGKDRPAVQGQGESVWSKNRRDDFIVLTKPGS
jgi:peptidoglycan-associated lipoprotein